MTAFSIRLGVWFRKPHRLPKELMGKPNMLRPGLVYGILRMGYRRDSNFVELSDGGHFENLGIYELIRRKVSTIIAIDAEEDSASAMPALLSAVVRVKEDFKADIDLKNCLDGLVPVASHGDFAEGPLREDSEVQVHLLAHAQEAAA